MFRVEVKVKKGWKTGIVSHATKEEAIEAMEKLVSLGHPKAKIRVTAETKIFG